MSDKNHGAKPPEKQGKKKSGRNTALYFFIAAGTLAFCWYYMTAWAALQIDPKHSQECALYQGVAWILASQVHKILFGICLALPLLVGLKLKGWAVAYYRMVVVIALVAIAGVTWDLSSPGDYFTSFVNKLLEVNFFDRS